MPISDGQYIISFGVVNEQMSPLHASGVRDMPDSGIPVLGSRPGPINHI